MIRRVTSPDGIAHQVALDWIGRKVRNPLAVSRRRAAGAWRRHPVRRWTRSGGPAEGAPRTAPPGAKAKPRKSRWWDSADCCDLGGIDDEFAIPLLIVVGVVVVALGLILGAPVVVVVVGVLLEFFYLVLAAAAVLVWRIVRRRPWRVVAVSAAGGTWEAEVVGWRSARAMVRTVAAGLADGRAPVVLGLRATDRRADDWADPSPSDDAPSPDPA